LSGETGLSSRREFLLYWGGFLTAVFGVTLILLTISEMLVDALSSRCWYPVLSSMLGVSKPVLPPQDFTIPYYCANPAVALVRFVFGFLANLIVVGAGGYMMLNGKKR